MRIFFLLFSVLVFSQNTMKPVELTTKNNEKLIGFINSEKIYDVEFYEFTNDINQSTKQIATSTVKEFVIDSTENYLVEDVLIDKNRKNDIQNYGDSEVKLINRRITMRKIVEGEYNLYISYFNNSQCFFYNTNSDANITYLIYNQTNTDGVLKTNMLFISQLKNLFKDNTLSDRLKYNKTDLVNLFVKKNGGTSKDLTKNDYSGKLQYKVFAGAKNYNIKFENEDFFGKSFSNSKAVVTFGAELLYNYSKKIDLFARVSFEDLGTISMSKNTNIPNGTSVIFEEFIYEAKHLNFNLGGRYYTSTKKNRLFIDLALDLNKKFDSRLLVISTPESNPSKENYAIISPQSSLSLNLGIGYEFHERYGLEMRYSTNQNLGFIKSKISSLNLNLYYKLN